VADHFFNGEGRYSTAETDLTQFQQGFLSAHEEHLQTNNLRNVHTVRLKEWYKEYTFSHKLAKCNLAQYLNSDGVVLRNWLNYPYLHHHFGYNALLELIKYFETEAEYTGKHIRLLHELYTHLSIIALVAEKLNSEKLIEKSRLNMDKCLALRNKLSKMIVKNVFFDDIVKTLSLIIKRDYEMCYELFDELNKKSIYS